MQRAGDGSRAASKWAARASFDPFQAASIDLSPDSNASETAEISTNKPDQGKENRRPSTGRTWGHPNVTMSRGGRQTPIADILLPSDASFDRSTTSSSLGKRPKATLQKTVFEDDDSSTEIYRDALVAANVAAHFEARAQELHGVSAALGLEEPVDEDEDTATLVVDDFSRVAHLRFGSVPFGEAKRMQLTLENPSELGNARVKYEGYAVVRTDNVSEGPLTKTRFKCDLHMCVVDALKTMKLRVTFEPLATDVGREITAMLKFTVNDRFKLQCKATGAATPRVPRLSRFGRLRKSQSTEQSAGTAVVAAKTRQHMLPRTESTQRPGQLSKRRSTDSRNAAFTISSALTVREGSFDGNNPVANPKAGDKRRTALAIEISPPRNGLKRQRTSMAKAQTPRKSFSTSQESSIAVTSPKKPFSGSWWKQRQEVYDENWMAKQSAGFTKWMNYVLLDGTAQRLREDGEEVDGEHQLGGVRRRFDFSSLRVLAQKRMESGWAQAAIELYHTAEMDDIFFNLQDEIGSKGLLFRADRPVYADVGLQEELISLLNNYHPVWLCLGLHAVLGHQVMKEEKCSLRAIFTTTTARPSIRGKKTASPDQKMPRVLRRIVLKHLVKDSQVAKNFRSVKNLLTPSDGSTADRNDGGNAFRSVKRNINGREYFDSLTETFMLKFFMLVIFLDRAIEHKASKFAHFPCLFRIVATGNNNTTSTSTKRSNKGGDDDNVKVKNSQVFVTEFCRFFLASEGRIDKHLKQLGYVLRHEQTALDEVDLEIKNWETDLRDGVRLAKLMESLTAPVPISSSREGENVSAPKGLSTYLRVPALSRLQKVHNVEICLHFLQDKCGPSVLDNIKSNGDKAGKKHRLSGRVRVSSSGFAGLRNKVDEKMVENLAKDIVNGHREKTLALLWKLISCFQLQSLVDAQTMKREIGNVLKRMSFRAKEFYDLEQQKAPITHSDEHECYGLLLHWCRAVCANYSLSVSDFSTSFADGKALCYLLHYYHPMLLTKADMLPTISDLFEGREVQETKESVLLANEQQHFALVNERIKQLGEVPVLMPQQYNTKNPPEEKMVVTFVCYLQSRLMDSYGEIHAASRLKRWWMSPFIRLRMHRKKNASARIIQRFWYTSSQKRLAIRQCRKLLRAAHLVKCTVQMWVTRRYFLRLKNSVVVMQRAFRAKQQQRVNGHSVDAVRIIQYHWRKQLKWRQEKERQVEKAMQRKIAHRLRMRTSIGVIERNWIQHLSREGARLVRQQMLADRTLAVSRIQIAWRQRCMAVEARKLRIKAWQQLHLAARVIQRAWSAFQKYREECQRVAALQRFEQMLKEKDLEKRKLTLKHKVEDHAANCVQKAFRRYALQKRIVAATKVVSVFRCAKQKVKFHNEKRAVVLLQRNIRVWRRRRHLRALSQFYDMLKTYRLMKASEAQRRQMRLQELKRAVEFRAACCIQDVFRSYRFQTQERSATKIQSLMRSWMQRNRYSALRQSVCILQRNARVWRRQKQLRVLLTFRRMLLCYREMQRQEQERQERERRQRLHRLLESVENRAAHRIQTLVRFHLQHKRILAATIIQSTFRGFKRQKQYTMTLTSVVTLQRAARSWIALTRFRRAMHRHRASVSIQKCLRGWVSRHHRFNFYGLQSQLQRLRVLTSCWKIEYWFVKCMARYRKKRAYCARARWTQLRTGIVRKRLADVSKIAVFWRAYHLRIIIDARIRQKRDMDTAAQRVQVWWLGLCCKWAERHRREEEKRQRELEAKMLSMAKTRATRIIGLWLRENVVVPFKKRNVHYVSVRKVQAWWRGTLVRLYHSTPEVTKQRKKLSTMKLVGQETHADASAATSGPRRVKTHQQSRTEKQQPQTLGARLEMALHMLLHGKRLQDMLFASHTIEVCTRYSHECCRKCVELQISSTIFAAIRGLNRSRPHVELLHQLLLVLVNLTTYRRSTEKNKQMQVLSTEDTDGRLQEDLRALDTLVDLLHIHRDMHHVFVLSSRVIEYYLEALKPLVDWNDDVLESWSEAKKRLSGLQELLSRRLALYTATASFRHLTQQYTERSSSSNLMKKMNPKEALSIMTQLVTLLEQED